MIGKIPAVSVSTELFKPAGTGLLNSSCILQLNITVLPNFTPDQGKADNSFTASVLLKLCVPYCLIGSFIILM